MPAAKGECLPIAKGSLSGSEYRFIGSFPNPGVGGIIAFCWETNPLMLAVSSPRPDMCGSGTTRISCLSIIQ